jgi:quinol monooxygenase YgiN
MEIFIFARFHAREGQADAVAAALREVVGPTRGEPGCRAIAAFRSTRDPRLFFIHSRWTHESAFDAHAEQPHTLRFLECVQRLIDHPLDVTRTRALGSQVHTDSAQAIAPHSPGE